MPITIYYNISSEDFDFIIVPNASISQKSNVNNVYYKDKLHMTHFPNNSEIKISLDIKSYDWIVNWFNVYGCLTSMCIQDYKRDMYLDLGKYGPLRNGNGHILRGCFVTSLSETEAILSCDFHEVVDDIFIKRHRRNSMIDEILD